MEDVSSYKKLNSQAHKRNSAYARSYKAKSASTAKCAGVELKVKVPESSKLPSNWEKYEQDIEADCNSSTYVVGIDIDMLSILPTNNSQFLMKQDKVFLPRNDSTLDPGEIFELDMELINLSLATIPFYKRIGMDPSLITNDNEIQHMNRKALDANVEYQAYLNRPTTESEVSCEVEIRTDDMGLDDAAPPAIRDRETKELEDWLDNVLEF